MDYKPKVLAFAGSVRKESFNRKLIKLGVQFAQEAGAEVKHIELKDYPLPLYDQDLEKDKGLPPEAQTLKDLFIKSDGFLISSPEYNTSITPLMKNTLDWVSRPPESPMPAYHEKVALILSASPGGLGGLRSLMHLRSILSDSGVYVLPEKQAVSRAHEAFNEDGSLKDKKMEMNIKAMILKFVETTKKLKANVI
jgi:chromate reductase, NAD(P)H dehydrogenase (quinone)